MITADQIGNREAVAWANTEPGDERTHRTVWRCARAVGIGRRFTFKVQGVPVTALTIAVDHEQVAIAVGSTIVIVDDPNKEDQ